MAKETKGLLERIKDKETVLVAEGYVFEFERRGYLQAGCFTPEVVLKHPHVVKNLHEEFVRCGSDVVLAFTYYGHREKLKLVGLDDKTEEQNRAALRIAREVANNTGTLMAGNLCNTTLYRDGDQEAIEKTKALFTEQVKWAVEEKADFLVGETLDCIGEAEMCLDTMKEFAPNLPKVITIPSPGELYNNEIPYAEACRRLEARGADVVGLNCTRGPATMLPLIKQIRRACKGPIACLPVMYRTHEESPIMFTLLNQNGDRAFPLDLDMWQSSRSEVAQFAKDAQEIGIEYLGICCGGRPHYMRTIAETLGRTVAASEYSPDLSKHYYIGSLENKKQFRDDYQGQMWKVGKMGGDMK